MGDYIWDHAVGFTVILRLIAIGVLLWAFGGSEKRFMDACTATGRTEVECKYEYLKSKNNTTYIPVVIPVR